VAAALAHHPSLAAARSCEEAPAAEVDRAAAERRPRVALKASATRFEEPVPVTPIHGFGLDSFPPFDRDLAQGELTVRYDLYAGGAHAADLERTRAQREAAGRALAGAEDRVIGRTVGAYVRVLGLAGVLAAHDLRLEALETERGRVEQMFAVGRAADVERKRIAAARAGAAAARVRLATSLDTAERELARLTGLPVEGVRAPRLAPVAPAGPPPERGPLADRALAASPEVARAAAEVAAAEAAIGLADSIRRPKLGVRGSYLEYATFEALEAGEWQAGLELTVPLLDGGGVAARVRAAEAARDAAEARLELARLQVLDDLDRALADAAEAAARAASLAEAVDSYAEVARVEALRLAHGAGVQSELIDAEADLLAARAELAEARFAEVAARTEAARVAGALDPAWVDDTLRPPTPPAPPSPPTPDEPPPPPSTATPPAPSTEPTEGP
jgi:outer membrane protein